MSDPAGDWIRQAHVDLEGLWETAAFSLYEAYDVTVGPRWRLDLDVQPYTEIWLIGAGRCSLTQGAQQAHAGPGQVVLVRPGMSRISANGGTEPLSLIGFGCSLLLLDVDLLGRLDLPLLIADPSPRLQELIGAAVRATHSGGIDRIFRARALAELALAEVITATGAELPGTAAPLRPEIAAALAFIAGHYRERLDLAAIASAVHLSPKYLARCFRSSLGITPMAYVRRHRLSRARELLVTSDLPVSRIALNTGFVQTAHFSRTFRSEFGVSPSIVREHARALRATAGHPEAIAGRAEALPSGQHRIR